MADLFLHEEIEKHNLHVKCTADRLHFACKREILKCLYHKQSDVCLTTYTINIAKDMLQTLCHYLILSICSLVCFSTLEPAIL